MTENTPSEVDALAAEILAAEQAAAADAAVAGALNPDPEAKPDPEPDAPVAPVADEVHEPHNPFSPNISPEAAPPVVIDLGEPPAKAPAKKAAAKK